MIFCGETLPSFSPAVHQLNLNLGSRHRPEVKAGSRDVSALNGLTSWPSVLTRECQFTVRVGVTLGCSVTFDWKCDEMNIKIRLKVGGKVWKCGAEILTGRVILRMNVRVVIISAVFIISGDTWWTHTRTHT